LTTFFYYLIKHGSKKIPKVDGQKKLTSFFQQQPSSSQVPPPPPSFAQFDLSFTLPLARTESDIQSVLTESDIQSVLTESDIQSIQTDRGKILLFL
jgi:hypothetical protein